MVQINDYYYENLNVAQLDRIIDAHASPGRRGRCCGIFHVCDLRRAAAGGGGPVTSAPPPPSREAVRLASQPPPASDEKGEGS